MAREEDETEESEPYEGSQYSLEGEEMGFDFFDEVFLILVPLVHHCQLYLTAFDLVLLALLGALPMAYSPHHRFFL